MSLTHLIYSYLQFAIVNNATETGKKAGILKLETDNYCFALINVLYCINGIIEATETENGAFCQGTIWCQNVWTLNIRC